MVDLAAVWQTLQGAVAVGAPQLRISPSSNANLFAIIDTSGRVGICLDVPTAVIPRGSIYPAMGAFRVRPEKSGLTTRIAVVLDQDQFRGVFTEMASDLVSWCGNEVDDRSAFIRLLKRLETWRNLFAGGAAPLSEARQVGLFGELLFLERLLGASSQQGAAIEAWVGPSRRPQDYVFEGALAVEVKTTVSGSGENDMEVASLEQLDPSNFAALFLWNMMLAVESGGAGRTLMQLVLAIRGMLRGDLLLASFGDRIKAAGYFDSHATHHYDSVAFSVTCSRVFRVLDGFPGLTRKTVPNAVRHAEYGLSLAAVPAVFEALEESAVEEVLSALGAGSGSSARK